MKKDNLKVKEYLKTVEAKYSEDLKAYKELVKEASPTKAEKVQLAALKEACAENSVLMQTATRCNSTGVTDSELAALAGNTGDNAKNAETVELKAQVSLLKSEVSTLKSKLAKSENKAEALKTSVNVLAAENNTLKNPPTPEVPTE